MEVEQPTISRLESGEIRYNQDTLERLALAYGCDPEDLLAINPLEPDKPRLIYAKLRDAGPVMQARALKVLEALLKAG